jgi:hypothetical protein
VLLIVLSVIVQLGALLSILRDLPQDATNLKPRDCAVDDGAAASSVNWPSVPYGELKSDEAGREIGAP